jgi:surface carbohydrate biosynthesis protein
MSAKFLILPIETKARELPGKTLLAAFAARAGFDVLLGDQRSIRGSIHRLPKGIFLDKSISRTKIERNRRLKELGHQIAAWCEEGLIYRDKTAYQFERLSPISMSLVDAFFAWGEVHRADVIEAIPEAKDKVYAVGNPRFDLLRQPYSSIAESEGRRLSAEHGKFILVVTTFSRFNKHQGQHGVLDVLQARGFTISAEQQAYYHRLVTHLGQVFAAFAAMIPALAKTFPGHTIVIRPHPSEDHDQWRKVVAEIGNAKVIYSGSVEPWLSAADAVVHNASTIGVEAFLLDRPVFSYMPVIDEVFNRPAHFPNMVSTRAHTVDDLLQAIRMAFEGRPSSPSDNRERKELVRRYVANASGRLATERIVEVLSDLHDAGPPGRSDPLSFLSAWSRLTARRSLSRLRNIVRRDRNFQSYMDQKFPGLTLEEIEDQLRVITQAGGLGDLDVVPHPDLHGCFMIAATGRQQAMKDEFLRPEPLMTA